VRFAEQYPCYAAFFFRGHPNPTRGSTGVPCPPTLAGGSVRALTSVLVRFLAPRAHQHARALGVVSDPATLALSWQVCTGRYPAFSLNASHYRRNCLHWRGGLPGPECSSLADPRYCARHESLIESQEYLIAGSCRFIRSEVSNNRVFRMGKYAPPDARNVVRQYLSKSRTAVLAVGR